MNYKKKWVGVGVALGAGAGVGVGVGVGVDMGVGVGTVEISSIVVYRQSGGDPFVGGVFDPVNKISSS